MENVKTSEEKNQLIRDIVLKGDDNPYSSRQSGGNPNNYNNTGNRNRYKKLKN